MHRELRELLHSAEGRSQHVVVTFLDVRNFSTFAGIAESSDTAEFLKSAYIRILDDYFPDADFFKPTGDGLLILRGYNRETLEDTIRETVATSVRLVENFPTLTEEDPMVNFEVPGELGIGLTRGAATLLASGTKALDYSGRPLNLGARLMDLARPSGVIFDSGFGLDLLAPDTQERFAKEQVYIKGIAEDTPVTVYCLKGRTQIPEINRSPMNDFQTFMEQEEKLTLRVLEERELFLHPLSKEPSVKDSIVVHISYPDVRKNKTKNPGIRRTLSPKASYVTTRGTHYAQIDYRPHVEKLKKTGVRSPWEITVVVEYLARPKA